MKFEYKCDLNLGNSFTISMYLVKSSTFDIFKCALRVNAAFFVTPCRLPDTPTSTFLQIFIQKKTKWVEYLGQLKFLKEKKKFITNLPFSFVDFAICQTA